MHRSLMLPIVLAVSLASLGLGWGLSFSISRSVAQKQGQGEYSIPKELKVPGYGRLILKTMAKGNQVYHCKAKPEDANVLEWTLKAPEAQLLDDKGQVVGHHYGGPTWESVDGSKVVGKVKTKVSAPQPEAIPWLLLMANANEGSGVFSSVRWIQRVNTVGGAAPKMGCDRVHQNQEISVPYTADYYFYGTSDDPKHSKS